MLVYPREAAFRRDCQRQRPHVGLDLGRVDIALVDGVVLEDAFADQVAVFQKADEFARF